jgi:hypothetical protein
MPEKKGEWVGIIYNLSTRQIEQVIVPSEPGAANALRWAEKNVGTGRAMVKMTRSAYDNCQDLAGTLLLRN